MKFANSSLRAAHGFTLIEIMVVVVILGILAALIAPNVISRIDDAQGAKVQQDVRAIESALKLYRLDRFRYPRPGRPGCARTPPRTPPSGGRRRITRPMPKDPWDRPYVSENPGSRVSSHLLLVATDNPRRWPRCRCRQWDLD